MDELRLRAKIDEFEIATRQANHEWVNFNMTDMFATWLTSQRYAKSYFPETVVAFYFITEIHVIHHRRV